jgi:antitoxin HigA-1
LGRDGFVVPNEIVLGKRGVSADTALRLSRYFGMSPHFWLGLQMDYELDVAEDSLEAKIEKEVTPMPAITGNSMTNLTAVKKHVEG